MMSRDESRAAKLRSKANKATDARRLFYAGNKRCYWCGRTCIHPDVSVQVKGKPTPPLSFTREHILPRAMGGSRRQENIVGACFECNSRRHCTVKRKPDPEAIRFARMTGIDPTGGVLTAWLQKGRTERTDYCVEAVKSILSGSTNLWIPAISPPPRSSPTDAENAIAAGRRRRLNLGRNARNAVAAES